MVIEDLQAFGDRSRYRRASAFLILVFAVAVTLTLIGIPDWVALGFGMLIFLAMTVITYHRLRDANLSIGWLLLMILPLGLGPTWHISENVTFNLGGSILGLVPVVLGWFTPANPSPTD